MNRFLVMALTLLMAGSVMAGPKYSVAKDKDGSLDVKNLAGKSQFKALKYTKTWAKFRIGNQWVVTLPRFHVHQPM